MDPRDEPQWADSGDSRTELEELQAICDALVTSLTALTDALDHLITSEPQHRAARIDA
ncbi:riboflavin biosynthesis pyrimidine reductase [Deinococcus enclensis]|uniref:Riboflavin biosynthesis pyrimidine reductase n=1 Tax=Deinococcus enclensis TaxID=1049582 RepID=A0ABT9MFY6_9DEIO|nr:riboflavin biosynthesis pyrimidine reductase [Deinococcus enclensis]